MRIVCKNTFHSSARMPMLFTDEQMRLFGVTEPKARRGRLPEDVRKSNAYSLRTNKCQYAVVTSLSHGLLNRTWKAPITDTNSNKIGEMEVQMGANEHNRVGFGFCTLILRCQGQESIVAVVDNNAVRGLAQMLNAVANSSRATWRKSSITT